MSNTPSSANIASWLPRMAAQQPDRPAIFYPGGRDANGKRQYTHYTFAQLDEAARNIAAGLDAYGITRGTRTVLMVKPSLEFFALTFALYEVGAVLVLVDPGIGIKNLGICLGRANPSAFIGIPAAQVARLLFGWARPTLKQIVTVGRKGPWGGTTLEAIKRVGATRTDWKMVEPSPDESAAILFTSGSTGPSKGAVYSHGNFLAQVDAIRDTYNIQPGEIDLPTFPLFALFAPALGMTAVIPDMDATRPASVNPEHILEAIDDFGVTTMFGSPALLNTVSRYAEKNNRKVSTLRRVISAGAPMQAPILRRMKAMLPEGALIHPPYGATECLPVSTMTGDEILADTWSKTQQGLGACIGRPLSTVDVRIIAITDTPIGTMADATVLPTGQVGEICVRAPTATREYYNDPENTAKAKIADGETFWHRMGDVGYLDEGGRIWFCGRKSHRVLCGETTMFTIPCEGVFNAVPGVFRTALVGVPDGRGGLEPALCVEMERKAPGDLEATFRDVLPALRARGAEFTHTRAIQHFLPHPGFPVDIRHNAKIGREKLAVWATKKLGRK